MNRSPRDSKYRFPSKSNGDWIANSHLPAAAWGNLAIVAVGESEIFAALGGTITFTHEGDKLRFEINIASAERCQLKISSQLQKLAAAVRRQP